MWLQYLGAMRTKHITNFTIIRGRKNAVFAPLKGHFRTILLHLTVAKLRKIYHAHHIIC